MKRLIVYDYEVVDIKVRFPYLSLVNEIYKEWLENRLKNAGFDLNKKMVMYYSPEMCAKIYEQDK